MPAEPARPHKTVFRARNTLIQYISLSCHSPIKQSPYLHTEKKIKIIRDKLSRLVSVRRALVTKQFSQCTTSTIRQPVPGSQDPVTTVHRRPVAPASGSGKCARAGSMISRHWPHPAIRFSLPRNAQLSRTVRVSRSPARRLSMSATDEAPASGTRSAYQSLSKGNRAVRSCLPYRC